MDSEVKNIISASSSDISAQTLLEDNLRGMKTGEVGGKKGKANSHCKNVITLHFIQMIPIVLYKVCLI